MEYKLQIFSMFGFDKPIYFPEPIELYIDMLPTTPKSCKRVLFLAEPEEILNVENEIINSLHQKFDIILTHNENILEKCDKAVLHEFGTCWIENFEFKEKKFAVSSLIGGKKITPNHLLRHELLRLKNQSFPIELDFYNSKNKPLYSDNELLKLKNPNSKKELFDYQFHIAIENCSRKNFFSEKLIDCFQTKTIPIYLGCTNINEWFDIDGMFLVNSIEEIKNVLEGIDENTYSSKMESINSNYEKSKNYCDFGTMIEKKIRKIFFQN